MCGPPTGVAIWTLPVALVRVVGGRGCHQQHHPITPLAAPTTTPQPHHPPPRPRSLHTGRRALDRALPSEGGGGYSAPGWRNHFRTAEPAACQQANGELLQPRRVLFGCCCPSCTCCFPPADPWCAVGGLKAEPPLYLSHTSTLSYPALDLPQRLERVRPPP